MSELVDKKKLWQIVEPVVVGAGFELVGLEFVRQGKWVLGVYIDYPNPEVVVGVGAFSSRGVTIDDCVRVSRELSAVLDVEDLITFSYNLEVSSPGPQRPLMKPSDFVKFIGCPVRIQTSHLIDASGGEGEFPARKKFRGEIVDVDELGVEVQVGEARYRIPFGEIERANLNPDMERWVALAMERRKNREE